MSADAEDSSRPWDPQRPSSIANITVANLDKEIYEIATAAEIARHLISYSMDKDKIKSTQEAMKTYLEKIKLLGRDPEPAEKEIIEAHSRAILFMEETHQRVEEFRKVMHERLHELKKTRKAALDHLMTVPIPNLWPADLEERTRP